jgi:hypothetical protein
MQYFINTSIASTVTPGIIQWWFLKMLMYKLWMIPIQYKYFLLLDYVHTVTFSSVFICVLTPKRMQTLSIYDRSCSLFNILEIFSFGSCVQGVKTIQGTKTFLKTLENDARVHIALFLN